ncbi:hypothetical protein [Duncaniella muris]|nr:hypothetical protein [Duncaniella muris]
MVCTLCVIVAVCVGVMLLVCGPIARSELRKAKLTIEKQGETINVNKLLLMTFLFCAVVEAAIILVVAYLVGVDRILDNKYFTIVVVGLLVTPIGMCFDHKMKRLIQKETLRTAISYAGGVVLLVLTYCFMTSIGFAGL